MPGAPRPLGGSLVVGIHSVNLSASFVEKTNRFHVSSFRSPMQRARARIVGGIDIGASLDEHERDVRVAFHRGAMKGPIPQLFVREIDVRTLVEEVSDGFRLAAERRVKEKIAQFIHPSLTVL